MSGDAFVLGNAQPQHYPIVYCSDGFLVLTRYPRASVMSRSCVCHFLWGPRTTVRERAKILQAFRHRTELFIELVFYKRTGKCLISIVLVYSLMSGPFYPRLDDL